MCLYSLYAGVNTRRAKVNETLTKAIYHNHHAFVAGDGKVACLKRNTQVELTIKLDPMAVASCYISSVKWDGKTVRAIMMQMHGWHYSADVLLMPNGERLHLDWLANGVTMRIPRKVRSDKGTKRPRARNLDKVLGLDQIKADIPVTKTETVSS